MLKSTIPLSVIALTAFAAPLPPADEPLRLKEETIIVEYAASAGEAVILVEAESEEPLSRVIVRDPAGIPLFELRAVGQDELALQGFVIETTETDLPSLLRAFAPGTYDMRARTGDGVPLRGGALLSHELPAAPVVTYPTDGMTGVPTEDLVVTWENDPNATGYRVVMEQGENDGLVVELPAGQSSLEIPDGILLPGTESHVEVGAIGPNRNCTLTEVAFTTR